MLHRLVSSFTLSILLAALSAPAAHAKGGTHDCPMHHTHRTPARYMASHHATPVTIYLDRDGGVLRAGHDDGRTGRSALVAANGLDRLTVPAFRGGDASWSQIVTCVRDGFSAFQVDIVDRQPASGDYVTIMVGGRPGLLGYGGSVSGVAPYGARILETAVGFVFSDQLRNRPRSVCESIMHEAGHTLGLDHTYHCEDVMSYRNCGPKRFTERVVPCGEGAPRSCGNGEDSQSSFAILADNVGLREAEPEPEYEAEPEPEYEAEPEPEYEPEPDAPADGGAWLPAPGFSSIEVEVTTDRRGDRQVQITAMTTGAGISEIELAWAMPGATYLFRCSRPPVHAPVTCQRQGPVAVFTLLVGEGERGFALRVTDGRGNQAVSDPLRLR